MANCLEKHNFCFKLHPISRVGLVEIATIPTFTVGAGVSESHPPKTLRTIWLLYIIYYNLTLTHNVHRHKITLVLVKHPKAKIKTNKPHFSLLSF